MFGQATINNSDSEIQELKDKYAILIKKKAFIFRFLSAQNISQFSYEKIKTYRSKLHEINQEIKKTEGELESYNAGSYIDYLKRNKEKQHSRLEFHEFERKKTPLGFNLEDPREMRANFVETLNYSKRKRFPYSDISIQLIDELKEKIHSDA